MSFRIENKYLICNENITQIYDFLRENSAKILFPRRKISSIYFDNSKFSSYNESIEGLVPRKKIRIRTYPNDKNKNQSFNLEIKVNSVEGRYKKIKKNINKNKYLKNGYFDSTYGLCHPLIKIIYYREYYELFGLRLTIDKSIKYIKYGSSKSKLSANSIIFEIKLNNLNYNNYIESKIPFEKTRYSKFCNGVEELNLI
jgi:hypothetical protein